MHKRIVIYKPLRFPTLHYCFNRSAALNMYSIYTTHWFWFLSMNWLLTHLSKLIINKSVR